MFIFVFMKDITVIVNTKSNFKNCNGIELKVDKFLGTIVSCKVPMYGFDENSQPIGDFMTADFNLNEVKTIKSI